MIWLLRVFCFFLCVYVLSVLFGNHEGSDIANKVTMSCIATALLVLILIMMEYRIGC